jgi:hypothetical protein
MLCAVCLLALVGPPTLGAAVLPSYGEWAEVCLRLATHRELGNRPVSGENLPLARYSEFAAVLDPFLDLCRTGELAQAEAWLGKGPDEAFYDLGKAYYLKSGGPFAPFAQRHEVPPGTRIFVHGDLHGDVHSLIAFLEALQRSGDLDGFRIARPEVRLLFLGDYTDRGQYGVEVLYTLMRLKLMNPEHVLLVRGNHEDISLVARYGFLSEIAAKYGRGFNVQRVARLYEFLPAVLYLVCGGDVIQCNHGGIEPGYQPLRLLEAPAPVSFQLLGRLNQRRLLVARPGWLTTLPLETRRQLNEHLVDFVPTSPMTPTVLGFMWNDFTIMAGEPQFAVDTGRAFVWGDAVARIVLDQSSTPEKRVRAIFRAHQHAAVLNPIMRRLVAARGVFRHWQVADHPGVRDASPEVLGELLESGSERVIPDGSVWTFNVSPNSVYGAGCGFAFTTAGELVTAARWEDWRLRVWNGGGAR